MTKSEFITFLIEKEQERGLNLSHWRKTYDNSDNFWHLYRPFLDWVEDEMCLYHENCVQITYEQSLYGNDSKKYETTYEDFVKNYDKTTSN